MKKSIFQSLTRSGILAILIILTVAAIYPLLFMLLTSFKTTTEYTSNPVGLPQSFGYLDNFIAMFSNLNMLQLLLNTIGYIVLAMILSLLVFIPASFTLAKLRFPFRRVFFMLIVTSLIIPGMTFIIPNYLSMAHLGLVDNFLSVVLLWAATSIPGSVFLLTSLMRGLPGEVLEATRVDGANYFHQLIRVVVPMSVSGIMTISIFNVTAWWNDLLTPLLFLQTDGKQTVTAAIATIGSRYATDYPLLMTSLLMASIFPILLYIFLQGYIRKGMVIGAIK
ncbi:carbohydrate ABC transporter permease [Dictyobacter kobayashii]|uniref:ABC transporter permease n=1 Tax=Dictyobacter kobayashii TaxID=2014872 RepID=A0A402AST8_9CHLR|nr:carbohydrate ABC transporter permease [Dictyobacter kobayashii]GCE22188.1 ABC transporter permease [Dictyobacter kobayashii]